VKEIQELLIITRKLNERYNRSFTLDGRLVGDIGEVLAAEKYGLKLFTENNYKHDAIQVKTGRLIQIKASFKGNSYFPYSYVPEYFLSIQVHENGEISEFFNGPGSFIKEHYIVERGLKSYKKVYYTLSKGVLMRLNKEVPEDQKIFPVKLNA